jgi:hypothetical protein
MKKTFGLSPALIILFATAFAAYKCTGDGKPKDGEIKTDVMPSEQNGAFLNHRDSIPTQAQYSGPLFVLSHDYPTSVTAVVNPSWQQALKGQPISTTNVFAYMDSLKSYVAPNVLPFFTNNKAWTSAKYGWFNEPWLGTQREAILGTYLGNGNPANMFKTLNVDEAGYALVLYDSTAAYTVGRIWGKTGEQVNLADNAAQFAEGSVIVKFAFSNINAANWPVMEGAQTFSIYDTIATPQDTKPGYQVRQVSFFQMDIIVKDSKTAPKTGWVYSTFVYDKSVAGKTFWDNMVPLGAMWGNDPAVKSPIKPPYPKLYETIINPAAPAYSTETLGWGGRLSGPNDGAVAQEAVDLKTGTVYKNLALSSCMSCHIPAQDNFNSFLLPAPNPKPSDTAFYVYTPGSTDWDLWFRDNAGTVPFDAGQVAMDYDMVMAFKSVSAYNAAHPSGENKLLKARIAAITKFRRHNTKSQFWH